MILLASKPSAIAALSILLLFASTSLLSAFPAILSLLALILSLSKPIAIAALSILLLFASTAPTNPLSLSSSLAPKTVVFRSSILSLRASTFSPKFCIAVLASSANLDNSLLLSSTAPITPAPSKGAFFTSSSVAIFSVILPLLSVSIILSPLLSPVRSWVLL